MTSVLDVRLPAAPGSSSVPICGGRKSPSGTDADRARRPSTIASAAWRRVLTTTSPSHSRFVNWVRGCRPSRAAAPLALTPAIMRVADLEVDLGARHVSRAGRSIDLTAKDSRFSSCCCAT